MELGLGMRMEQGQGWGWSGTDASSLQTNSFSGPSRTAWGCFSFPQPKKMIKVYENKSVVFKFCEAKRTNLLMASSSSSSLHLQDLLPTRIFQPQLCSVVVPVAMLNLNPHHPQPL